MEATVAGIEMLDGTVAIDYRTKIAYILHHQEWIEIGTWEHHLLSLTPSGKELLKGYLDASR